MAIAKINWGSQLAPRKLFFYFWFWGFHWAIFGIGW